MWEDDLRRAGIKRRGPQSKQTGIIHTGVEGGSSDAFSPRPDRGGAHDTTTEEGKIVPFPLGQRISPWPFDLDSVESGLLDHYIASFSRTYPTFSTADNPFLRVFVPLSMRSRVVLDALLALSGVQSWEGGEFKMARPMLQLRQRTIRGCMELVGRVSSASGVEEGGTVSSAVYSALRATSRNGVLGPVADDVIFLLAGCVLLLLYEKLSGEAYDAAAPHLRFFARIFPARDALLDTHGRAPSAGGGSGGETLRFLMYLFLYNDLVRSTSSRVPTLSGFYAGLGDLRGFLSSRVDDDDGGDTEGARFVLPSIIARCSAGDPSVKDEDLAAWDGRLDWFPSFALVDPGRGEHHETLPTADPHFVLNPSYRELASLTRLCIWSEQALVAELYRVAATVYKKQCFLEHDALGESYLLTEVGASRNKRANMGNLPSWAVELLQHIPAKSAWENCLLWPIGIIAKELVEQWERVHILSILRRLERRFRLKLYSSVREHLLACWEVRDRSGVYVDEHPVMCG